MLAASDCPQFPAPQKYSLGLSSGTRLIPMDGSVLFTRVLYRAKYPVLDVFLEVMSDRFIF